MPRWTRTAVIACVVAPLSILVSCATPAPGVADPHPFHLHPWAVCIRQHESDRGPWPHDSGYQAQNPKSTASGAYQFLNSTWAVLSAKAGQGGYRSAKDAPVAVQDAVAQHAHDHGYAHHWGACRGL
jgi:hypothetical protein